MNPLLDFSGLPRYPDFKPTLVTPAVEQLLAESRALIERVAAPGVPATWRDFVQPLEETNERLHRALELKLFEDQKDSIKLTSLVSTVVDKDTQEKIEVVKSRLIRDFGYDEVSATDVLNFVASIFARGDVKS